MKKLRRMVAVLLTVGLLAAVAVPASAATIKLSKTKATISVGNTVRLKVKGTEKKVTWKSSNKKVATVNGTGRVTGKKVGKATITAKVSGKTLKCKVTVKKKSKNQKIYLSKTSEELYIGKSRTLEVKGTSEDPDWSSSNDEVATVDEDGKVVGKKAGKATITAKVNGKKLKCKFKVKHLLTVSSKKVDVNGTGKVKVTLHKYATVYCQPEDGSYVDCTWDKKWSDWTKNGTTSTNLNFTGKKEGTVKVFLTNNYSAEKVTLTVNVKKVKS